VVARGLVNFDAVELPPLLGRSTRDLAREFGVEYEREVVHRDDLVVIDAGDTARNDTRAGRDNTVVMDV
jgi:glutamate 5-kinase